jgi:hypothetical protein
MAESCIHHPAAVISNMLCLLQDSSHVMNSFVVKGVQHQQLIYQSTMTIFGRLVIHNFWSLLLL